MNRFDQIQELLGLTDKEKAQILSINMANNPNRLYKEVWIGLGGTQSAVYATEVSPEEYLCYTTEETEKIQVLNRAAQLGGNIEAAIKQLANERREMMYESNIRISQNRGRYFSFGRGYPCCAVISIIVGMTRKIR